MKFNGDGTLLLCGFGRLLVNGVCPRGLENFNAIDWDFLTNDVIAGRGADSPNGPWRLYEYDLLNQELWQLDPRTATEFYASASGKWVAFVAGTPLTSFDAGVYWTDRVAIGMSPQQDELFRPQPSYRGLIVRDRLGIERDVAPGVEVPWACMDEGVVLYLGPGSQLYSDGDTAPQTPTGGVLNVSFCTMPDGTKFIVGYVPTAGGLVVFPWVPSGPLTGMLLSTDGHDFNPAIAVRESGILVVGTGTNQGETQSRLYEIDLPEQRFRVSTLPSAPGEWQPLKAVNLLTPPVVLPTLPDLHHDVSIAVYKDLEDQSGCNSEILVNVQHQATNRPCWSLIECLPWRKGELLGLYTEGRIGNDGMEVLPKAEELNTRILWGWDDLGVPQIPSKLRTYDVVGLECYPPRVKGQETFTKTVERWISNLHILLELWPNDIGLILPYYCMGGAHPNETYIVQEIVNYIGAAVPLINHSPRIKLAAPFSFDRANGISAHPELREMLNRLNAATPGAATFQPVTPEPEPMPKLGDRGAFRVGGSTVTPTNATIVACQDAGFLSLNIEVEPTDGKYHVVHFNHVTGAQDGERNEPIGTGEERIKFVKDNVFMSRSGDMQHGPMMPFEWYPRT